MSDRLDALQAAGVLAALDVQLARALARLSGERDPDVLLAVAFASRTTQSGHVCLPLATFLEQAQRLLNAQADSGATLPSIAWPTLAAWRSALHASPLVDSALTSPASDSGNVRPLVLDARDRLYLRRLYEQERFVAAAVAERASAPALPVDEAVLREGLDRLFGASAKPAQSARPTASARASKKNKASDKQLSLLELEPPQTIPRAPLLEPVQLSIFEDDAQRAAAELAVRSRFTVVIGGPGTGKTSTVVRMLALLVEQALAAGSAPPTVRLLAPTGKAAARLAESVRDAREALPCEPNVIAAIHDEASTLHRALGAPAGDDRRSGGIEPLLADVVIVDEASMVDLAMMARLFSRTPPAARLVLLGDKDQLASVEAGAVLGDICGGIESAQPASLPLARCIAPLTSSRRYAEGSGIKALAEAIRKGDVGRALQVLGDAKLPDVQLREHRSGIDPRLLERAVEENKVLLALKEPGDRLRALGRFRVLCAHRHGPFGVIEQNLRIEAALRGRGTPRRSGSSYDGRPILVTENSYDAKLYNGDVGVLTAVDEELYAWFDAPAATAALPSDPSPEQPLARIRRVPLVRLPAHESVYAMSVHKSQGSEVDEVAVVLPDEASPLLSRELLYTAVTRARVKVIVYASLPALAACIERVVVRASGLREALWGAAP
jgi:exodeoxyribonuclease V alpha subunit